MSDSCLNAHGSVVLSMTAEWRLRRWARENYVPPQERAQVRWHPVVCDEFARIDAERAAAARRPRPVAMEAGLRELSDVPVRSSLPAVRVPPADLADPPPAEETDAAADAHADTGGLRYHVYKRPQIVRLLAGTLRVDRPRGGLAGPHFWLSGCRRRCIKDLRRRAPETGHR